MQIIRALDVNSAWVKTLLALYASEPTDNQKYFRDEPVLIRVENPSVDPANPLFPMSQTDLDIINNYIHSGENEDKVIHEWTKLYYHRAFDEPYSQIEFMIQKLQAGTPKGEAQISMWEKEVDQSADVSPCTQIIWGRVKFDKLELHVHAHSSDAYKKLLMNMLEFISLQHYIAKRIGKEVGEYYHFIDSCHLHNKDLEKIEATVSQLSFE